MTEKDGFSNGQRLRKERSDRPGTRTIAFIPSRKILLILFATLFFAYSYIHQRGFRGFIPASRLDLLHSLIRYKAIYIDAYHDNTRDKAIHGGHYYSDKAPGCAFMAFPAFCLAAGVLELFGISLDSDRGWLISSWIACAGSLAVVTALGAIALFTWLCKWVSQRHAYVITIGLFLGAAPLPYCTFLMSHSMVVGLLCIALWAGDFASRDDSCSAHPWVSLRDLVAGFCCGLALASEYSAGIAVIGIIILFTISDIRRILSLGLGMLPPTMLIPAYHWICFGTPFTFAYSHEAVFVEMHKGFFGISGPPRAEAAFSLLFEPNRGLFFWSPFLLMTIIGYYHLIAVSRKCFWIAYLVPVAQIIAISAYFFPGAGGTLGPRLLAPILPLMALPCALGIAKYPRLGSILVFVSIAMTLPATAVDAVSTASYHNLKQLYLRAFVEGDLSYNLGAILGLPVCISLLVLLLGLGLLIVMTWRLLAPRHLANEAELRNAR